MRDTRVPSRALALCRSKSRHICIALALLVSPAVLAQNASLSGKVMDPTGAFIPGAEITLTRLGTGATSLAESHNQGVYNFPFVSPGQYRLDVTANGFKKFEQTSMIGQSLPAAV